MDRISVLDPDTLYFPPVDNALSSPNGLVAAGGDLSPERLEVAYRSGIFPWFNDDQPILWWSPDPRSVLYPGKLHVSRSLRKTVRSRQYRVTLDRAFEDVIHYCAGSRSSAPAASSEGGGGSSSATWISGEMEDAYTELHRRGLAHSVEAWSDETLVGGLYGIAMGKLFFGESMFSHQRDASKVALVHLVECLIGWGYELIDCQVHNDHLASLGAEEIPREIFMEYLAVGLDTADAPTVGWDEQ